MTKKRIKILTTGAITVKGFINGPVLTPYWEDTATIFSMVSKGIHVVEVCDDGSEVRLTLNNFADDNSKVSREAKKAKQAELVNNIMNGNNDTIKEESTEVKEEVKEETVEESEITEPIIEEKKEEVVEAEVIPEVKEEVQAEPADEVKETIKDTKPQYQQNNNYKNNNYNNKHNKHNKNTNYKNNNVVRVESADAIKVGN